MRHLLLTFLLLSAAVPGHASEAYLTAFETANPHLRKAVSYLRTGNSDLAAVEVESFLAGWPPVDGRVADGVIGKVVLDTAKAAQQAIADIDAGKPDDARKKLLDARQQLFDMHKTRQFKPFADCIWAAIGTGNPLWGYRDPAPDLANAATSKKIVGVTKDYLQALRGCRARAPKEIATDPEYTRLMDNADKSLSAIPASVKARDGGQLHRYLIELRSIDRLLYFRFG